MPQPLDHKLYEQIFRETYSRYYYLSLHVVGNDEVARDIVSEVFAQLWQRRETVNTDTVYSYLFRSVRNASIDHLRRKEHTAAVDLRLLADVSSDEEWLEENERIEKMQSVISTMSERTRHVLHQRYREHKTYKEVAAEMGITTDGVKAHVTKALRILRQELS